MARQPSSDVGAVSTSSTYSAKMASQISRTMTEMILCFTLQPNVMAVYFDPDARCRSVMASFVSWSSGALFRDAREDSM